MDKRAVLFVSLFFSLAWGARNAAAITDYAINLIDKGTEYVEQVGQVQEDVASQMSEYMNVKVGIPGDAKAVQKAAEKAQRIKEKAEKYQAKAEKMQKKMEKAKEKAAAVKAEKDKLQAKADKIKAEYQKAQDKVNKAKAKIAEAKAKAEEIKSKVDDAKAQIDEVKSGINDIKEGAAAIKGAAEAKLDEAKEKISGSDDGASAEEEYAADAAADETEPADENAEEADTADAAAEPSSGAAATPVSVKADTLSALNGMMRENAVRTEVGAAIALPENLNAAAALTPQEVLSRAEEIKVDTPEKAELSSPYDLQEQLKMMDEAKAKELSEQRPKYISQEELEGLLKAGDEAKLEALRAGRQPVRKGFEQKTDSLKGETNVK